jgi:hypothetical protein
MAEIKNNADPVIPVSKKVKSGMSLNVCDQQWIKRLLDTQAGAIGEAFDVNITQLTKALAEVQEDQNKRMFTVLEEQHCLIKEIKDDVKEIKDDIIEIKAKLGELDNKQHDHDIEIVLLKKYSSFWSTALRIGITVGIAVGITLMIIL